MTNGWTPTPLGNILEPVVRENSVDPTAEYRLLGIRLDGAGPFLRETKLGSEIAANSVNEVKAGDFIYSRLFAWRGAFGIIKEEFDGCFVSNEFPTFRPVDGRIDVRFLNYWFRLRSVIVAVEADCSGSTPLTRNRYKEPYFLRLQVPLPPLLEQRRIVAKIEQLAARIEKARELQQHSLSESNILQRNTSRKVFEQSERNQHTPLEEVCTNIIDCLHSNPVYSEDGIATLRSPDVGWGKLFLDTARKTSEKEYRRRTQRGEPKIDDIILVREGGGTGKAGIVEDGHRLSLGQRVMQLRPNQQKILPRFLLHQWLSPLVQQDQIAERMKGSASPHLNIGALRKFDFILPPLEEQRRIVAYLDSLQAKVDRLKALQAQTAAELEALLPSILDKAFKGEL